MDDTLNRNLKSHKNTPTVGLPNWVISTTALIFLSILAVLTSQLYFPIGISIVSIYVLDLIGASSNKLKNIFCYLSMLKKCSILVLVISKFLPIPTVAQNNFLYKIPFLILSCLCFR